MVRRKERVSVLLDSNVLVRALADSKGKSPSAWVWRLWLQRRIQLAVSAEVVAEYLEILDRIGVESSHAQFFERQLREGETVTRVNLGRRLRVARDPDDDMILSTADSARVDYLVTLDKDLLELPWDERRRLKFQIVTPAELLEMIE
jgi:putative PIN family toxin of toxin-antitoxin system